MGKKPREKFDDVTEKWLEAQSKSSQSSYAYRWKFFQEFTGKTGAEILVSRREDKAAFWETTVLEFKAFMLEKKKAAPHSAKAATTAARSFFAYYRSPLIFRRQESARLGKSSRVTEDYRFTLENFGKMVAVADLQEKYIITAGKSFGLRAGDFLRIRRGNLEPYIDRETPISIGEFATEKEDVKAFPFIDPDAKPVIKLMLEKMDMEGRTKPSDRILIYKDEIQLSRVLQRVTKRAGINVGDKEVRFHLLRKFLTDHLSSHMSESKWKQVVGKEIGEGAYVSPDSLREDYARVIPETCFSYQRTEDIAQRAKKEALLVVAKIAGISETDLRTMFRRKVSTVDEEIEEIERILAENQKLRDNSEKAGGGLAFQQQARTALADLFLGALADVKEKLKEAS
jgi:integrase